MTPVGMCGLVYSRLIHGNFESRWAAIRQERVRFGVTCVEYLDLDESWFICRCERRRLVGQYGLVIANAEMNRWPRCVFCQSACFKSNRIRVNGGTITSIVYISY